MWFEKQGEIHGPLSHKLYASDEHGLFRGFTLVLVRVVQKTTQCGWPGCNDQVRQN